jgi:undecaprenyl-diphosphatase
MISPATPSRDDTQRARPASARRRQSSPSAMPARWEPRQIALASGLWLVGLIALVVLSILAHQYHTFPGDLRIERWVQNLLPDAALTHFINFASDANWPVPAGIIVIVVTLLLVIARRYRAAIATAIAGFGAANLSFVVNKLVARPRPAGGGIHAVANLGLYSYPSGHVSQVVSFYGFLLYLSIHEGRAHPTWRRWLWIVQVICVYFLICIGPSRVLEGEHWPSDVVASYLLGSLCLAVVIALYHAMGLWWARHQAGRQAQRQPRVPGPTGAPRPEPSASQAS